MRRLLAVFALAWLLPQGVHGETAFAQPSVDEPVVAQLLPATVDERPGVVSPGATMPSDMGPFIGEPPPAPVEPPPPPTPRSPMEAEIWNLARTAFAREVLTQLYEARDWLPLWRDTATARELVAAVRDVELQGLSPSAYGVEELESVAGAPPSDRRDVILSRAFVRLAFDLRFGRVPVSKYGVAAATTKRLADGDNAAELAAAIESRRVGDFLEEMQPPFALYKRLGTALERYREIAANGGWKHVDSGPTLRPGDRDRRVPQLRKRLAATGDFQGAEDSASDLYEGDVVDAVKSFQERHGLAPDGVAGPKTIEAMNIPASRRVNQIRATMERTRQFLHDLPERYVVVNTASFSVYLIDGGQPVWSARIIVGKREQETPVFRANIESFILNPEWNVPQSIVRNELLPGLARDPRKLEKMRIRRIGERYVQQSGAHSALGRIKFNMPNDHAVYLHDTPTKNLFERQERAFSHGCVRVEHPFELAAHLLGDPSKDAKTLEKEMLNGKTKTYRLPEPVPVLVMTWSVVVSGDGRVDFLTDLYGQDDEVLAGLDGTPMPVKKKAPSPASASVKKRPAPAPVGAASAPAPAPASTSAPSPAPRSGAESTRLWPEPEESQRIAPLIASPP